LNTSYRGKLKNETLINKYSQESEGKLRTLIIGVP